MNILAWITALGLAGMTAMAGAGKVMGSKMSTDMMAHLGVPTSQTRMIGAAEVAGAIGVIIGVLNDASDLEWIGLLAGLGLIALMIGAVVYHQRAGDPMKQSAPAFVVMALAVVYLIAIMAR